MDGGGYLQEGRPYAGASGGGAIAGFVVAVDAASVAESGAVDPAERLHRKPKRDVLTRGLGQVEDVVLVDDDAFGGLAVVEGPDAACRVKDGQGFFVNRYGDRLDVRFEAAAASGLDCGAQLGGNPDGLIRLDELHGPYDLDFAVWNGDAFVNGILPSGAAWLPCKLGNVKVHNDTAPWDNQRGLGRMMP